MIVSRATIHANSGFSRSRHLMRLYVGVSISALLLIPLILSEYEFSWLKILFGTLLLVVCVYPCARYFACHETGLPTMPVFCLAYAMQFAFPVFSHDDTFLLLGGEVKYLEDKDVISALVIALLGILALQAGYYWFQKSRHKELVPVAHLPLEKSKALLYCVLVGLLLPVLFVLQGLIPEQFQLPLSSILRLLQNQILVVIGILGWLVYGRKESKVFTVWLYGLVVIASMRGISSGALEEALVPIGVLFVVKWLYTRRVPVTPILATAALVIFLSPVKSDYRQLVWMGDDPELAQQSSLTRGVTWIEQAAEYWGKTIAGDRDFIEATSSATGRADFIHQMAHIYSMTPAVVPYQYGKTYSFFAVSFIPRVIWPDKPLAGSANSFYAVSYGVTNEEGAKTTTFGVSILGEAFINFGWYGIVFVMLFQGVLISVLQHAFGGSESGPGGQAVFLAFFVFFLNGIGSSAEIMFGGILQNLLCGYFLLLWAKERPGQRLLQSAQSLRPLRATADGLVQAAERSSKY
jgi:hypothetical protein